MVSITIKPGNYFFVAKMLSEKEYSKTRQAEFRIRVIWLDPDPVIKKKFGTHYQ